jgi:hypothetical protein
MRICTIAEQYLQTADEFTLEWPPLCSITGGSFQAVYPGQDSMLFVVYNLFRAVLTEIIN